MTILSARNLRRTYGTRDVLRDATLSIADGERVGLVGRNGSGKSTLAEILAGREPPDAGTVTRRNELRVGYLTQAPQLTPGATAIEVVLEGLAAWQAAVALHDALSTRLEHGDGDADVLLRRQAEAAARVEALGGWTMRHEAATILGHVGIVNTEAIVDSMSGGELRRVALAQILVASPDVAILDEPTNHLDVGAVQWLETWLAERHRGALILITHDRYLLDRVVTRTLEVEDGEVFSYEGGWGRYLEAKAERTAMAERVESNRQNFLRRELEWLRRSPAARTTKQKARIDRAHTVLSQSGPKADKVAAIELQSVRSGNMIIEAEEASISIAGRLLVDRLTLRLGEGERIGIVGPNGCGKTSLLRALVGTAQPTSGTVRHGKNTRIAYLDQERSGLIDERTIFDNVASDRGDIELGGQRMEVRTYLERFLFGTHEQRQLVGTLSGGERARVALAKLLRDGANVVVLDEPTNDLDVMTLAALEEALLDYGGTVLVVTHDRWFLDRIATSMLVFEGTRVIQHAGGWSDWQERTLATASPSVAASPRDTTPKRDTKRDASPPVRRGLSFTEKHELEGLLDRVDAAERKVADLEAQTCAEGFFAKPRADQQTVLTALDEARLAAAALAARWTELEERNVPS